MDTQNKGRNMGGLKNSLGRQEYTTNDIIDAFRKAMLEHLEHVPDVIIADGLAHRFSTSGKKGDKAGRYILHIDGGIPAGYFECHRSGVKQRWKASGELMPAMGAEERAALRAEAERKSQQRQRAESLKKQETSDKAASIWRFARTAPHDYPYLERKRIKPNGARLHRMSLVIPMYSIDGRLWNLQYISSDGSKTFMSGGHKKGLFSVLGGVKLADAQRALLVEGWATGCTCAELEPGIPVIVAFDAGNLITVTEAILGKYPALMITLVADDDGRKSKYQGKNIGLEKALEVAAKFPSVQVVVPDFPINAPEQLSDINDLIVWRGGAGEVAP